MLSQLIYTSDVLDEGIQGGAEAILEVAREKNAAANLTGLLVFDTTCFLQCLEGGREQLTDTYHRIALDPRHRNVTLIVCTDIDERDYPDWAMGHLSITAPTREIVRRFGPSVKMAPRDMPVASVVAMLKVLRQNMTLTV